MLFTIGLLLLLTPFPSFQTTTNEKRDSTGSDVTKPNTIFTLLKPQPTAALTKQAVHPTLKPNTVNQTVLPTPAINQKSVNTTVTTKSKIRPAVIQTTPSPVVKATTHSGTIINKDKPTVSINQTKSLSASEVKNSKEKPSPNVAQTVLSALAVKKSIAAFHRHIAADNKDKVTVAANQTALTPAQSIRSKTIKDKLQPSVSHTVKLSSGSEPRASKDKPAPTGTADVQSTSTSTGVGKTIKDRLQPSANETGSVKVPSSSEVKGSKAKSVPTGAPDVQSAPTKSASASGTKTIKVKLHPSANETVSVKVPLSSEVRGSKVKSAATGVPDVPSTSTKLASASGTKDIKRKLLLSANHTVSVKSPSVTEVRDNKEKPAPTGVLDVQSTSTKSASTSGTKDIKGKLNPSANQTVSVKSPSASEVKTSKDKSAGTGVPNVQSTSTKSTSTSGSRVIKDKLHPSANQTVLAKSPSASEVKTSKDKSAATGVPNVQSTSTKSTSVIGSTTTKDKVQPSANHTVSVKSPSASEVKTSKDKSLATGFPNVQSTSTKSVSTSGTKGKLLPSANQTVSVRSPSVGEVRDNKEKPAPTRVPDVQSTPTKSASTSGTKDIKDKLHPSANQTVSVESPSASEVKTSKDKFAATGVPNVPSTSTKSTSASGSTTTKDKVQPSVNHTISVKSTKDGMASKDKPVLTKVQNVQSTSTNSGLSSGPKTPKNKPTAFINQTTVAKNPSSDAKNSKDGPSHSTVLSTPEKAATTGGSAADKDKVTVSANHTTVIKAPTTTKENPTLSKPINIVISNGCESSNAKDQELKLQPGAPLVMTHKISLMPGSCTGECDSEMATLKERVARLEREMTLLKEKCPCSGNCPDDCSSNGECEKGKCVCHQGFIGPDCKAVRGKTEETVETVTQQLNKDEEKTQEETSKTSKVEQTVRKRTEVTKLKVSTTAKPDVTKTQVKQEASVGKTGPYKGPSIATTTSSSTRDQVDLTNEGKKQEEVRKGKTTVFISQKGLQINDPQKDKPIFIATQSDEKKSNGTSDIVTLLTKGLGTNKTRTGKETVEQSVSERNITQSSGHKHSKTEKVGTTNIQSVGNTDSVVQNKTTSHGPEVRRGKGGQGLGSVKVVNISSYSFTLTWLAPQDMFKNFTVIRREPQRADDKDDQEEALKEEKNSIQSQIQTGSTNTVAKSPPSISKADTKRISIVVPGSVRSVEFSNLRANTRYELQIYGTGAQKRSKIHRATAVTGPESATDIVFSNVTESSIAVSWSKPKTTFTGFRVTYTNIVTGENHFVTVDSRQSHVVLSKLSAGTSYVISVTTVQGRAQSDALTSVITTVPAPPTHLQVINVTDSRAVLKWTPGLGKVDRFIISFESSKTPNVTVTVMLSGNSAEHQLRGLQRGTLYTVKVLSQKDSLQSMAISTTFTTANVVKASEVGPRSAVIIWRTPTVVYQSYRVTYQLAGEEKKEVILDPTITEYKLTGLLPMSRYIVLVQGEREGQYTSLVTTEFITGKLRFPFPTECSQELLNGALHSGEVDIYPQGKEGPSVRVYCDMETDGGGWTVFQRRMNGKTDFYRTWREYSAGFGNLSEEFWLGNKLLRNLTSVGPVSLRVDLRSGNDTAYAHYADFSIDSEKRHYALSVSGFSGTAGDSMKYHNGRPFSTWDKDPDSLGIHCAKAYMGGWWYKNCYKTNLNGLYGINSNNQGIVWIDWKGKDASIPFTEMKFRPLRFSPATHG